MVARCGMCNNDRVECRHFALYTVGSEGTVLCHECEMLVVDYIQTMRRILNMSFQRGFKARMEAMR